MYTHADKGYYYCNNKQFRNKLDAILESNVSGELVQWDFYSNEFAKANWATPSTASLDELYKLRAQQLRDNYDHLVLFYSGGADSGYILKTFLDNNIKIDEIYLFGAFEQEKKHFSRIGFDSTPGFYTREIEYIAKPLIKNLLKTQNVKVNMYDWEQDILNAAHNGDWFWEAGCRFAPDVLMRSKFHKIFREHSDMLDKGKKVGFIYGVDKPRLYRDDTTIKSSFLDIILTIGTTNANDIKGESWEHDEYFYWNPNFPEIPIKQAHMVAEHLKMLNKVELIPHLNNHGGNFHTPELYKIINRVIYPNWNHDLWQIKKPTGSTYDENSAWFFNENLPEFKMWEDSLKDMERQLGSKWFNNNTFVDGLRGHISELYDITTY